MNQSIYIIILIVLLSFAVYKIIKKLCYPIKTTTAILLVVPTIVSCGGAIFVYNVLRGSFTGINYSNSATTNTNFNVEQAPKKEEKKKVGRSFTDSCGKTMYYDKEGNTITSNTNYLGEETFPDGTTTKTDSSGNKYYS